jgi:hypothetical protein
MSPTVFRHGSYRFFFFSREETRMHVHVTGPKGEAKYWLEPIVALTDYEGLNSRELKQLEKIVYEKRDEIIKAWKKHFNA